MRGNVTLVAPNRSALILYCYQLVAFSCMLANLSTSFLSTGHMCRHIFIMYAVEPFIPVALDVQPGIDTGKTQLRAVHFDFLVCALNASEIAVTSKAWV